MKAYWFEGVRVDLMDDQELHELAVHIEALLRSARHGDDFRRRVFLLATYEMIWQELAVREAVLSLF